MKKAFISFLIMTLILGSISLANLQSVQAATADETSTTSTDDTIKVSLENIKDIMTENNLEIKILFNNVKIQREKYDAAKDEYESAKDVRDSAEDDYDDAVAADDGTTDAKSDILDAKEDLEAKEILLATADGKLDDARDSLKTVRNSYEQGIEDKVYAAQEAYISYLSSVSNLKIKEDEAKAYTSDIKVYKLKYESGFISKNEYTSLIQDNTTSVNDLKDLRDAEELARTKLCYTLGISPEENVIFEDEITLNLDVIAQIDYSSDLDKMLSNNNDIQLQNDEIDDLEDEEDTYEDNDEEDLYDYEVENADYKLKDLINDKETSFKAQYNTVINSYNSIKNNYNILYEKEKSYKIMETKRDYGFASKKEVETAKRTLDSDRTSFNESKNTLYINYLRYLQMKEGY